MPLLDASTRRRLGLALLAVVAVVAWDAVVFLPLRILVVVFHEAGHAITALLTGGSVVSISVSANEGGTTLTRGGSPMLILNGGYLGSLLAGVALLWLSRRDGRGRAVLGVLGVMLAVAALAWFRPVASFGFFYALSAAAVMLGLAARASGQVADWLVRAVGLFSVLYAVFDIRADVLAHGFDAGRVPSDAAMLAAATGVPALVWGLGWLTIGGLVIWRLRATLLREC